MATLTVPDCVPSVQEDVEQLHKAFSGWGTNEDLIINILAHRNAAQRKAIREAYAETHGQDLLKALDKELNSDFERAVLLWTLESSERDAYLANESTKMWTSSNQVLMEIACTRSPKELVLAREAYHARYKKSLEEDVSYHTKGDCRKLLVPLVTAYRYPGDEANLVLAKKEAKLIHDKIQDKAFSDDDIIRIISTRSKAQINATLNQYKNLYENDVEKEMTGIKVDNRVNFECLVEVKKHLTPGNFERMLSEYQLIDFLYKIADFPLQTQTMKWLMKSGEVVSNRTPSKRYMKFNLGGHDYKFGHVEFALISGLNFEHIPSVDESVMTPLREFLGQSTLFVQLGAKLDEASAKDKDSELTRKLVVLVIVHSLIFPKTDFKVVHVKSICLVDEPDLFNLYPWGRMIYDEIIKEWWIFFARISKEKAKGTKMTFRLVTFPIMIQCWVLECLTPELSCLLGERVPGKIYPRILRWTRTDFGDIKLAEQTIFHADEVFFIRMTPEEDELEKVYYKNVLAYLGYDPEPVKTVPLKRRRMQPTEDDGDDDVPGFLSISLNLKKLASKMDKGLQQLGNRLGALEEKVSKLEMEMPTEIERKSVKRMKNTIAYDLKVAKYEMMKEVRAELNLKPPSPIRPFEVCEVDYEDDGAEKSIEEPAIVVIEEPALNNRGRPRRERKAANVIEETKLSYQGRPHREKKPVIKSPYTDLEKKYKRRKMKDAVKIDTKDWVDDPLPTPYNPPEDYAYNTTKWDILKSWIDGNLYRENIVGLEAVVDTVAAISCKVLKNLVSEKGWLSNEDIDAMLRLLNMQQDTFPRTFTSTRWTCLGSVYNRLIRPAYESFSKNRLLVAAEGAAQMDVPWELINMDLCQVVAGMNMSWFSKPWKNCDYVYGIQNIANMHWVAYEYDFKEKEVKVYDSLRSDIPTDIFGLHAAIIPSLYNLEVENKEDKMDPDIPFNVKYVDVPRQPNTHDCGVYSCKFVQCLAMQKSCGDLKAEHFIDFRRKFGVDLVKWAKDTNGNHVFYETDILV